MTDKLLPPPEPDPIGRATSDVGGQRWQWDQAEPDAGATVARYIAALRRYKFLVAAVALVGMVMGFFVARRQPREYAAAATIWVADKAGRGDALGPIRAHELLEASSWLDLVKAPAILDQVVIEQHLYVQAIARDAPNFAGLTLSGNVRPGAYTFKVDDAGSRYTLYLNKQVAEEGTLGDTVGRSSGFRWVPPQALQRAKVTAQFGLLAPRDAATFLAQQLSVVLAEQSNFMRMSLTSRDPQRAALTLNSIVHHFIATAADLKRRNLVEFEKTLESQLAYSQTALHNAETALENFRVHTITLPTEGTAVAVGLEATRDPVLKAYFDRKLEYDNLRHDRESLERVLGDMHSGTASLDAVQTLPAIQQSSPELKSALDELTMKQAALRAAQQTYTDEHPLVKSLRAQIATLQGQTIPTLSARVVDGMRRREADLDSRINGATRDLRDIPTRTIEEMRLRRDVTVKENLYTMLKNRYEEARLADASTIPDVSILDSAVAPTFPVSNDGPRFLLFAIVGSLGAGVALAVLLDRLDQCVRYPEQVSGEMGLHIIGAVQTLRKHRGGGTDPEEAAQVVEAFRSIRMSVLQAFPPGAPVQFVITSAGPGEGKSLVAANLSLCFAEAGVRALLIDGDIRRGQLHALFGAPRRPGLVDILMDGADVAETLRPTTHENLTLMPSGSRRQRGPEHLSSDELSTLLAKVRPHYDVIIIDSPPLNAGIDPFALSTLAGYMLFVVRAGVTDRKMAVQKLAMMDRLPVRLLGAVLNGIRSQDREYQYYSYAAGYTLTEGTEEDTPVQLAPGLQPIKKKAKSRR